MGQWDAPRDRPWVAAAVDATAPMRGHHRLPGFASSDVLVGRRDEVARLSSALDDACAGRGGVLTVCGEPGIGKTRLIEESLHEAERRGVLALVGRCYETADAPALWPWTQVVEAYLEGSDVRAVHSELRPYATAIAEAIPELRRRLGVVDKVAYLEPGRARFRVFDSLARFLTAVAQARPIVIVLEDIHAADPASVHLLQFVARECAGVGLLIVASYRDLEVDAASPLATALSELRGPRHDEIKLSGLARDDATLLVEQAARAPVSNAVAQAVVHHSEGNPLFILELLRALGEEAHAEGRDDALATRLLDRNGAVPLGVRALIERRLTRLSATCTRMLVTAAAIGREFDISELEQVTENSRRDLLSSLDEARARRVVSERTDDIGRYRFSHALVRASLYDRIGTADRAALHRRIATALENLHGRDLERHLPEIADHFIRGALAGDADKALDYAVRAGRAAVARHAYEEAVRHYERALSVWRLGARRDDADRCALLIDLAEAEQSAGDPQRAREGFSAALELARALRREGHVQAPELLARAVLGVGSIWGVFGVFDAPLVALLDEALTGLAGDSALRARLLARAAVAYYWCDAVEKRHALSAEAVAIARRLGNDATLGNALYARRFAIFGPDRSDEQLALVEEIVRLGESCGDGELSLTGRHWRIRDHLEVGDLDSARRDLREYARIAGEIRHPHFLWNATYPEGMFAGLEGRLADAAELAARALDLGRRGISQNAEQYFGIQMLMLARLRGAEESAIEPARDFVERVPGIPAWRAALASLYAVAGREREATEELERLAAADLARVPRDANFLVACAMLTETCAVLEQRAYARVIYDLARPYASRSVIVAMGAGHLGVMAHYLGLLASVLGRADRADAWFADALRRYEAMGARSFVARVLLDRAQSALKSRRRDRTEVGSDPVRTMLERAAALAHEIGMDRCATQAERLLQGLAVGTTKCGTRAPESANPYLFHCEGAYWTLAYDGVIARVKDTKGLHYVQELLRTPGRDCHVLDLTGLEAPAVTQVSRSFGRAGLHQIGHDAGPVLDGRARAEYRQRIEDLRDEAEEAEARGDIGRVERARAELDHLTSALADAIGLGGRSKRAAHSAERARLNVTRAIRAIVGRIGLVNVGLARHLDTSIVTGRFCRYQPHDGERVDWSF